MLNPLFNKTTRLHQDDRIALGDLLLYRLENRSNHWSNPVSEKDHGVLGKSVKDVRSNTLMVRVSVLEVHRPSLQKPGCFECHGCSGKGSKKLHACPLESDLRADDSFECNCCKECQKSCNDYL